MNRPGFGLVEAMVSLVVVSSVSIGALAALAQGYTALATARQNLVVLHLAEAKLAEVRTSDASSVRALAHVPLSAGTFENPFNDCTWSIVVSEIGTGLGLYRVDVDAQRGSTVSRLNTLVYRP